jgi:phenylalanyl-tRNA synthetase alpha chain
MPYTIPKLTDFSASTLDRAVDDLLSALEQESAAVGSESDWKAFRDRWMARKNGILAQLNELWLKVSPGANKREVGQRVNELKTKVELAVEAAERPRASSRPSVSTSPFLAFAGPLARNTL